jgi:hypothetical protein
MLLKVARNYEVDFSPLYSRTDVMSLARVAMGIIDRLPSSET